jgi:hypothetical protein
VIKHPEVAFTLSLKIHSLEDHSSSQTLSQETTGGITCERHLLLLHPIFCDVFSIAATTLIPPGRRDNADSARPPFPSTTLCS